MASRKVRLLSSGCDTTPRRLRLQRVDGCGRPDAIHAITRGTRRESLSRFLKLQGSLPDEPRESPSGGGV
jgi:hypothetical protein